MAVNEQIEILCKELQLPSLANTYHELSNRAAKENWKYSEYLHEVLKSEADGKAERSKATLTKMADSLRLRHSNSLTSILL